MAARLTRDGETIRVDYVVRWYGRLFALPLLAVCLGLLFCVFLGLKQDLSGEDAWRDNLPGLLIFTALGLGIGLPELMALTYRYFVLIERMHGNVTVVRQFGTLKFRQARKLADFTLISITDDGDRTATQFSVNLCGKKGTRPIVLSGFTERQAANDFARELGTELMLPFKDVVGTEPDDPDLATEPASGSAALPRHGRKPTAAPAA
jgi:hypothetical protein